MSPSRPLRILALALLPALLAACGAPPAPPAPRPAMVVRPVGGQVALEAYAGEVHAREEPTLAFRIPGKITRRLVDAGSRVRAGDSTRRLPSA